MHPLPPPPAVVVGCALLVLLVVDVRIVVGGAGDVTVVRLVVGAADEVVDRIVLGAADEVVVRIVVGAAVGLLVVRVGLTVVGRPGTVPVGGGLVTVVTMLPSQYSTTPSRFMYLSTVDMPVVPLMLHIVFFSVVFAGSLLPLLGYSIW